MRFMETGVELSEAHGTMARQSIPKMKTHTIRSQRFTRRRFLQSTALLAAGAPLLLPGRLRAAGTAPSERITLGFIGMGRQNGSLLNGFLRRAGTQVLAVCDVDTTRREHAKKLVEDSYARENGTTYKGCAAYSDFRELLAREDIDAVVIATPDHWHAYIAIAAANAKKDIYCEKPLCQSIHEARAMVSAVRANDRVFQTGSQQRSSREFRTTADLIRHGAIGKIERVEVSVGGPAVPCDLPGEELEPGLDWERWLGPAAQRPYNSILSPRGVHDHFPRWRSYREFGGGGVTDWGAHHFDIVQWALNMDESGPVEIIPANNPAATEGVRFRYANGAEVEHKSGNGIWFHGSEGRIYVNRNRFQFWIGSEQKADEPAYVNQIADEYLPADAKRVYHSNDHLDDWLECIRARKRPICDVETGARTVTVCHLVNLAYYHGQRLKWVPQREQFAEGTGDPKWLDVPHREPWTI
jgi:predicted dehydrogenase